MAKLTRYQADTLREIGKGKVMLRGKFDRYWWDSDDKLCSAVARRLHSKGLIRPVYFNSVRDVVQITAAGRLALFDCEMGVKRRG